MRAPAIMTRPSEVVDLDQAVFFIYPDSEALKSEYASLESPKSPKQFMDSYLKSLWTEIQTSFEPIISEYFWHDEGIHWDLVDRSSDPFSTFIHGQIRFGDGMEDEWFVLRLLLNLTAKTSSLVASIFDTDGDFILIESADALPEWLEPGNSRNRVFIHEGAVKIVPIENFSSGPSLQEALKYIRSSSSRPHLSINAAIEAKVNEKQILHRAQVRIPHRIAQILDEKPDLISAAISAFYNREPESMKICTEMPKFNPNKSGGPLLTTTLFMTRIHFAQLACQEFVVPSNSFVDFDVQSCDNPVAVDLGVKLTCGFEILMSQSCPKFVTKNLFDNSPLSVRNLIDEILSKPLKPLEDLMNDEPEDSLDWMEISQEALDSELNEKMNRLSMNENEETELLKDWTEEFENDANKISGMKKELSEIDGIVEKMKKMIEASSTFEGIDAEESDYDSDDEDDSDEFDSENDEGLLEREIFETINFDPDLLMKILEANAHSGVSSEEFLVRFRKYQEENPTNADKPAPIRKQKGLADIEEAKVAEARKSRRKSVFEDEKDAEDLVEVDDEFIYGKPAEEEKKESNFIVDSSSSDEEQVKVAGFAYKDDELKQDDETECPYEDYYDVMDRQLQSELKSSFSADLDESTNLGQNLLESMGAGVGNVGGNPVETVISGMGKKMPRPC